MPETWPLKSKTGIPLPTIVSAFITRTQRSTTSRAAAVLVPEQLIGLLSDSDESGGPAARIVVRDPQAALVVVLRALYPDAPPVSGIDSTARIGAGVILGGDVSIGPFVV